jgi:hypothetical protein
MLDTMPAIGDLLFHGSYTSPEATGGRRPNVIRVTRVCDPSGFYHVFVDPEHTSQRRQAGDMEHYTHFDPLWTRDMEPWQGMTVEPTQPRLMEV